MTAAYIEPMPRGRSEATPVTAYAVETRAGRVLKSLATLEDAIEWAKARHYSVQVALVRSTDKGNPDHWRKA
jgi:hypothetical protein